MRGLAALLALVAMVIGTPLVLTVIAPLQLSDLHLPGWDEIADALLRPDDGTLLLTALTVVAWVGWALFALLVLAEAVAQSRGLPLVRVPGLGGPQRAVTVLVAAVSVMLAPAASAADSAHAAHALTRNALLTPGSTEQAPAQTGWLPADPGVTPGATDRGPDRVPTMPRDVPAVMVRTGDSLWELAERHLGSGTRYPEIAELNYDRPQPDGRALTRDHWIHPGWTLHLPADATNLLGTRTTPDEGDYTVRSGDTLTGIAADRLGDPDRYPEIVDLNVDRPQDDGATLADPDQIRPGWQLTLPDDRADKPDGDPALTEPPRLEAPPGAQTSSVPAPVPSLRPAGSTPAPTSADPAAAVAPDSTGSTPAAPSTGPPPPLPAQATSADQDDWDLKAPITALLAGLGGIAAAGVLREVALRRRRGQRRRSAGQRLPAVSTRAADTGRALRAHQQPVTLGLLRTSLRALVATCRAHRQPLPRIAAVLLNPHRIELRLADPHPYRQGDEALPPFRAVGSRRWQLDPALLSPEPDDAAQPVTSTVSAATGDRAPAASDQDDLDSPGDDATDPCPALVTVGTTGEDLVMINLEAAGTLTIAGEPEARLGVIRALAVELVTSPLTQDCEITLSPALADLAHVTDVVRARTAPDAAVTALRTQTHHRDTATTWAAEGVGDVLDARARNLAHDTWAARIDIATADDEAVSEADPWSGRVLVLAATTQEATQGWLLDLTPDSSGRIDPLGITVTPQRLDAENYAAVLEVLGPTDPEPVAPNRAGRPQAAEQPQGAVPLLRKVTGDVATDEPEPSTPEPIRTSEPALRSASLREVLRSGHHLARASVFDTHTSAVLDALPIYDELMASRTTPGGQRLEVVEPEPTLRPVAPVGGSTPDPQPLSSPDPRRPAPRVLILGSVEVVGADDSVLPERRRRFIELVAYLALHPGGSRHALDEAMWPGARVPGDTRNAMVSRARKWLGEAPDGRPYLLPYNSADGYRLHPDITTDWHDFLTFSRRGLEAGPENGVDDLTAALDLVRGRPFHGIDPRDYAWADPDIQEMISTLADVAHLAAQSVSRPDDAATQRVVRLLRLIKSWS